jgi:hypothetical protein
MSLEVANRLASWIQIHSQMINEKLCGSIASLRHGLNYRVLAQDAEQTREKALLSHVCQNVSSRRLARVERLAILDGCCFDIASIMNLFSTTL